MTVSPSNATSLLTSTVFSPNTLRLSLLASLGMVVGLLTPLSSQAANQANDEIAVINATDNNSLPTTTFDTIVVTASRSPTKQSNTIAQTQVIDAKELKRYQAQTVLDVIKQQPGFSYVQNGGMGTAGNFYVRGYDSKQVLVLIDGIRYGSLSAGQPAINLLPASQVERIEILYGASGSSIYGADAMGGVIQIFTKNGQDSNSIATATIGAGSHNLYQYGGSVQYHNDNGTALSLSASHVKTKGINATLPTSAVYYPDKDGFESKNYSLALSQRINDSLDVGITGLYSNSTTDFDSKDFSTNKNIVSAHSKQKNGAAQAYVDWSYQPNSSVKLQYGQSIDKTTSYDSNPSFHNTTQKQASLVGQHELNTGKVLYGAEHLIQSLDSDQYKTDDRKVTSGFAGYLLANDNVDVQANIRYDDNSQYGGHTTYNLGGAYHVMPQLRVGANYAKGFRAPSFNDLYSPYGGNPELKPENSDNYEVFVEYNGSLQTTRLTGYQNKVDNLITYELTPTPTNPWAGTNKNIDKSKIKGVNLTSDWDLDNYLFGLSYDYQKAKDASGKKNDGNFLAIRPEHKGLAYLGYQFPKANIRAEYQYVGDYYRSADNLDSQKIKHYGLLNISGNYQLTPQLSMSTRLNNVTNKKYITLPDYNTDGINFFTSLTYDW